MLSYKFTKENIFSPKQEVDRDGDDYQQQLRSLQETMKSIREMDHADLERFASRDWDEQVIKKSNLQSSL